MANSENFKCRSVNCQLAQVDQIEDGNQALFAACKKTSRIPGGELAVYPEQKKNTPESNAYRIECLTAECQVEPKRQILLQVPRLIRT